MIKFNALVGCKIVLANPKYNCIPHLSVLKMVTASLRPSNTAGTRIAGQSGGAGLFKRSGHPSRLSLLPAFLNESIEVLLL